MKNVVEYELIQHAEMRMQERSILSEWLEAALTTPKLVEPDATDSDFEHRLVVILECDHRVLRVVCAPKTNSLRVITVHFDLNMKGRL